MQLTLWPRHRFTYLYLSAGAPALVEAKGLTEKADFLGEDMTVWIMVLLQLIISYIMNSV